jgi:hypothetical protein
MTYSSVDERFARLLAAGWSIGDIASAIVTTYVVVVSSILVQGLTIGRSPVAGSRSAIRQQPRAVLKAALQPPPLREGGTVVGGWDSPSGRKRSKSRPRTLDRESRKRIHSLLFIFPLSPTGD